MEETNAEARLKDINILVVDDTPANLTLLANMLNREGCKVRPVPSGKLALKMVENDPPDLILLDINMPDMNGYEVCQRLKADRRFAEIPIIFISALSETLDKVRAFNTGGVDYITKPFQFEEVLARVGTHVKLRRYQVFLEELVREKVREIAASQLATIFALSKLAESRDKETGEHLERIQAFCRILAERLSQDSPYRNCIDAVFVHNITHASPLHDIGKVAISDAILLKPGKLSPDEFEIMKTHTLVGAKTLGDVSTQYPGNSLIDMGLLIARNHHEHWDGTGYPDGLAGEAIALPARILAIADVYDALRSRRCYKDPLDRDQCRTIILEGSGTHFDPELVNAFAQVEEEFERIGVEMESN